MNSKVLKFMAIGGIGFVVDLLTFILCVNVLNLSPYVSRAIAFMVALTCTWLGNKHFTFSDIECKNYGSQCVKFGISAGIAAIPNFIVFHLVLQMLGEGFYQGICALLSGVIAGAMTNYLLSSRWVFISSNENRPSETN